MIHKIMVVETREQISLRAKSIVSLLLLRQATMVHAGKVKYSFLLL